MKEGGGRAGGGVKERGGNQVWLKVGGSREGERKQRKARALKADEERGGGGSGERGGEERTR